MGLVFPFKGLGVASYLLSGLISELVRGSVLIYDGSLTRRQRCHAHRSPMLFVVDCVRDSQRPSEQPLWSRLHVPQATIYA